MTTNNQPRPGDIPVRNRFRRPIEACWRFLVLVVAGATVWIAFCIFTGHLDPARALASGLAALAALALALAGALPSEHTARFLGQLRTIKVGSFAIELGPYEREFARKASDETEDDKKATAVDEDDKQNTAAHDLFGLKRSFEMRLAYLAKWVLAVDHAYAFASTDDALLTALKSTPVQQRLMPTYLNVGSLAYDRYFDDDEARIAYDIVGMRGEEFAALSRRDREIFINGANSFVKGMRIRVFHKEVREQIAGLGWCVYRADDAGPRDLIVNAPGSPDRHHVIPVIANNSHSHIVKTLTARLANTQHLCGGGRRFLLVPPPFDKGKNNDELLLRHKPALDEQTRVWTVTLNALTRWLGRAPTTR